MKIKIKLGSGEIKMFLATLDSMGISYELESASESGVKAEVETESPKSAPSDSSPDSAPSALGF